MTQSNMGVNPVAVAPANSPEEKGSDLSGVNIWMILTAVFAVLAIGGVVFGVVMMKNSNQKAEELNSQVESLEDRNDELLNQLIEQSDDENTGIKLDPVLMKTSDYIYVGEWGIKIKKPDNWQSIIREYSYYNNTQSSSVLEIKENPEVPTAHALIINYGEVSCDSITTQYDACFAVRENAFVVTDLPSVDSGGVSEAFRNFVLDNNNYSVI